MMPIADPKTNAPQPEKGVTILWRTSKALLVVGAILGLASLNVLTLVNDNVHAAGFNFLRSVIAPAVTENTLSRLLSQSPTQKYSALDKSHKAIEARHLELKRVSAIRTEVANRVSTRIGRRAVANAVKNVSSFAAEAIPFVGVAAIVTLTASDVYDDCQTLKDLNELNIAFENEKEDEATVCGMKVPLHR